MSTNSKATGFLLFVVLSGTGVALVIVPSFLVEQYERISRLGPTWGTIYWAVVSTGAVLLTGSTLWILFRLWRVTRSKRERRQRQAKSASQLTAQQQQQEIRENLASVDAFQDDPTIAGEMRSQLQPLVEKIEQKQQHQTLEIVAFGTVSSGKSSLLNALAGRDVFVTDVRGGTSVTRNEMPWPGADRVLLVDTPGLGEVDGAARQETAAQAAQDADLVLLVVDGPLRQSEFALLENLARMEKRVLICLAKDDVYQPDERQVLLGQIAQQVGRFVSSDDVVSVRSCPTQRQRRRVLPDQSETVESVPIAPDIEPLARRMMSIVRRDGRDLLLANLLLQSRGLVDQAHQRVQDALDRRAREIIKKYMWGAGGAAALSPFPVVDLAAGCAVSTKMVVDLARVYRQDVDLDVAVNLLGQQGLFAAFFVGTADHVV